MVSLVPTCTYFCWVHVGVEWQGHQVICSALNQTALQGGFRSRVHQEDVCPGCLTPLSVLSVPPQLRGWAWDGAPDGAQVAMC